MIRSTQGRTDLAKEIPLAVPIVVHIELADICNLKCKFCPSVKSNNIDHTALGGQRSYCVMPFSTCRKAIDDIKALGKKVKSMYFHKDGESLLNKEAIKCIQYAVQQGVADNYMLFTNGTLLTHVLSEQLAESGLTYIQISFEHVSSDGYHKVTGVGVNWENFVSEVAYLHICCEKFGVILDAKLVDVDLTESERTKFNSDLESKADVIHIEKPMSCDAMIVPIEEKQLGLTYDYHQIREFVICTRPFYTCGINSDGTVSACSPDSAHALIMGNINEQSFSEIWNGKKYNDFRRLHLLGRANEVKFCSVCFHKRLQMDNIDYCAGDILLRLPR
jgi:radical SAM protein with 4Fe4S-binding SPASM domain